MGEDVTVIRPEPDDYGFTFNSIKKGYAAIGVLLEDRKGINHAIATYAAIAGHPVTAEKFSPENTADKLKEGVISLRLASGRWQKDRSEDPAELQRRYGEIVTTAYNDCAKPLACLQEAMNVIQRALVAEERHEGTSHIVAGLSHEDLVQSFTHLQRASQIIGSFAEQLRGISTHGNFAIGIENTPEAEAGMVRQLARPVRRERNPDFEKEVHFFVIDGMLIAERDNILNSLSKIKPGAHAEALRASFCEVAKCIARYAKFGIERPDAAIHQMQNDIPRCLEALQEVKKQLGETEFSALDVLMNSIESLKQSGPSRGRAGHAGK